MATYREIQKYVKDTYAFVPKTYWIAHAKEMLSSPIEVAPNRISLTQRQMTCPTDKLQAIKEAFEHFKML
jgi:hypothetical protein